MANEFIARKGLIALEDSQITGSLSVSSSFTASGLNYPSADGTGGQVMVQMGQVTSHLTYQMPKK